MDLDCHRWDFYIYGEDDRGEDAHTPGPDGGEFEVGNGTCSIEHSGSCAGSIDAPEEQDLLLALESGHHATVEQLFASSSGVWLEFNRDRMAFQVLGVCEDLGKPIVLSHIPVTRAAAYRWAELDHLPQP